MVSIAFFSDRFVFFPIVFLPDFDFLEASGVSFSTGGFTVLTTMLSVNILTILGRLLSLELLDDDDELLDDDDELLDDDDELLDDEHTDELLDDDDELLDDEHTDDRHDQLDDEDELELLDEELLEEDLFNICLARLALKTGLPFGKTIL